MDSRILAGVLADYDLKRRENEREEARRLEEINALHPDLAALIRQRHDLVLRSVRTAFSGGAPKDPEGVMEEYNRKILSLLQAKGYPADYLSPIRSCPICGDTGYYYEASVQKTCDCLKQAYLNALSRAGMESQTAQTFQNFDMSRFPNDPLPGTDVTQREYMGIVRQKCEQYAAQLPSGPIRTLLLHGGSGLGKTYLLNCIANSARERGIHSLSVTAYDLLMALKNAYFSRTGEAADEYFSVPLLLIDDLGMEPLIENVTVEQIYHLINSRLTQGLHTVISTNLSRTELKEKYTERVSSRLLDTRSGLAIPFQGKDIRLLQK